MICQLNERQLIPQIIINYRRHNTTGLQPSMMMLWAWAGVPLGVYNITKKFNVALRIQPQILTLLSLVTWTQCRYYDKVSIVFISLLSFNYLAIMHENANPNARNGPSPVVFLWSSLLLSSWLAYKLASFLLFEPPTLRNSHGQTR